MSALERGRADGAGGLGATVNTYKSELDWGGTCRRGQTGNRLLI